MTPKREPVVLVMSILAGLTFFFGGMAGIGYFSENAIWGLVGALGTLATAAATTGVQFWVRGQVTPVEDAVKFKEDLGLPDDMTPPATRRLDE